MNPRKENKAVESKIHTAVMFTDTGKEKQVRFPIDEEVYKGVKKQPKGVRKQVSPSSIRTT